MTHLSPERRTTDEDGFHRCSVIRKTPAATPRPRAARRPGVAGPLGVAARQRANLTNLPNLTFKIWFKRDK
jgi:hypothetical protein